MKSQILFASANYFLAKILHKLRFPFEACLNIISEREDFKFSIGSLNNRFSLCGSGVAKQFLIGIVLVKLRCQYGSQCQRNNIKNHEPQLEKKDK